MSDQAKQTIERAREWLEAFEAVGVHDCNNEQGRASLYAQSAAGFVQDLLDLAERLQRKAEAFHLANGYFSIAFTCENAHHEKSDQKHGFGDDNCPVVQRWRKARDNVEGSDE